MSDTKISEKPPINPVLKMSLELGPLVVFFFANSRGAWLAEKFPALAELGGPIFIATALFMAATSMVIAKNASETLIQFSIAKIMVILKRIDQLIGASNVLPKVRR